MEDEDGGGHHNKIGEEEDEKISSPSSNNKNTNKGKGLKKWKRIQRTTITAASASAEEDDLHRFLKRDSRRFAVPHTSSTAGAGGDSDNSEGKSSTAASVPTKFRNSRNHRTGTSVNRPKNKIEETSKKLRGGGGDNDRDVSYSSVESDLRSSSFFSNGGGRRLHYDDADHSSEAQSYHYEEEVSASASATVNAPSSSQDLLSDAIVSLHAVHQALQKEIQSFGEIGKEAVVLKADELVFEEEVKGKERELLREDWKWREMEQLFAHKVEAEVQCLVIRQKFKEQNKNKNTALLLHTEEDEDPLKLRSAASKYGYFFCVQFIILFVVLLRLLFLQLWPGSTGFVPT